MKIHAISIVVAIVLALSGCNSTKTTLKERIERLEKSNDSLSRTKKTTEIRTDTVFRDRTITQRYETEIEVPIDCDSLGNIRDYRSISSSGSSRLDVILKSNRLLLRFKQDSLVNVVEKRFRDRFRSDSTELVHKYEKRIAELTESLESSKITKKDWKTIFVLLAIIAVQMLLIFRKNIPWLRWLPF